MTILRKRPYGPAQPQRVQAFERQLPAALPADYREFLFDSNGADVEDCAEFDEVPGSTCVDSLWGLHDGPPFLRLDHMRESMTTVPGSMLVIGSDPYGNYFGLDLVERPGSVWFIDHETLAGASGPELVQVAPSFDALLARIGSAEAPPPPASPEEAVAQHDAEALAALLAQGASASGLTHHAVHSGHPEVLRLVLRNGGDVNERGGLGNETPLFIAARSGRADLARLLIEHGADANARCDAGGTALEMAEPWPDVFRVLADAGATSSIPRLLENVRRLRDK